MTDSGKSKWMIDGDMVYMLDETGGRNWITIHVQAWTREAKHNETDLQIAKIIQDLLNGSETTLGAPETDKPSLTTRDTK